MHKKWLRYSLPIILFLLSAGGIYTYIRFHKLPPDIISPQTFRQLSLKEQWRFFEKFLSEKGGVAGREFLLEAYSEQPSRLHSMGHLIGEALYHEFWDEALGMCDSTFSFSCYHGVIIGVLRSEGAMSKEKLERFAYEGCKNKPSMVDFHGCYHGLGHALMVANASDLPASMKECDELVIDDRLLFDCYQGVAMENAQSTFSDNEVADFMEKPYLRQADPYYPCNAVDKKYAAACYSEHVPYVLTLLGDQWERVADFCALLPGVGEFEKKACFSRIGVTADGLFQGDLREIERICRLAPQYEEVCITGFARQRAFANDMERARAACQLMSEEREIQNCLFIIRGALYGTYQQKF